MRQLLLIILIILISSGTIFARNGKLVINDNYIPEPELLAPVTSEVDLMGKDSLLFKWSPHTSGVTDRRYFDFRLYKGPQMVESALVLKRQIPKDQYEVSIEAGLFENGQMYTWSLKQICYSGKSRRSDHTFKVIK